MISLCAAAACAGEERPRNAKQPLDTSSTFSSGPSRLALTTELEPLIDVHVHTSPRLYRLTDELLRANRVSRFVNLSGGPVGPRLERSLNAARSFDGRLKVCVNINWRLLPRADFIARQLRALERAHSLGAACLKISKALGLYVPDPESRARPAKLLPIDAPRLDPIWRKAGELGFPVFIHSGDPKAFFEPLTPENERYDELSVHPSWSFADRSRFPSREAILAARNRVIARHPETIFIGVHFANNSEDIQAVGEALARYPNLYVDIAARVPELGRHPPAKLREIFTRFADRV